MKRWWWILLVATLDAHWRPVLPGGPWTIQDPEAGWIAYGDPASRSFSNLGPAAWKAMSVGYQRFNWAELEPRDGEFRFEKIESNLVDCRERGKGFAFRVFCANYYGGGRSSVATPPWVFEAGAKGMGSPSGGAVVPVWDDPVFLNRIGRFHRALAAAFDGAPGLRFVDLGSYGNWGENHLGELAAFQSPITARAFMDLHARPFRKAFSKTPTALCSKWDDSRNVVFKGEGPEERKEVFRQLAEDGYWLRWDGAVQRGMDPGKPLGLALPGTPGILEWCFSLGETVTRPEWKDWLVRDMKAGRASYFSMGLFRGDSERLAVEFPDVIEAGRALLGWRLDLRSVRTGGDGRIVLDCVKHGVATLPKTLFLEWGLEHGDGTLIRLETEPIPNDPIRNDGEVFETRCPILPKDGEGPRRLTLGIAYTQAGVRMESPWTSPRSPATHRILIGVSP